MTCVGDDDEFEFDDYVWCFTCGVLGKFRIFYKRVARHLERIAHDS